MNKKLLAQELTKIAKSLQARDVYDLKSMGGGLDDCNVFPGLEEFEISPGLYSGGSHARWIKAIPAGMNEDQAYESAKKETKELEKDLKEALEKFDDAAMAIFKKHGYSKK